MVQESSIETIEILLATYNGAEYIGKQIDSILAQTNTKWHLTVSDDGSTDETVLILENYQSHYPDRICRVRSGKKFGNAKDHFYWLLQNCDADYIFFCDQDDVWKPDKVEKSIDALKTMEEQHGKTCPVMAFTDLTVVDAQLNPVFDSLMYIQQQNPDIRDYRQLLFKNVVNGNTQAINRSLRDLSLECVDFSSTMMHDWWIAITAARFGKITYLPEQTVLYRQHGDNSVGANNAHTARFFLHKLTNLSELQKNLSEKARQAGVFLETYSEYLSEKERKILKEYSARHMSLQTKLEYLQWLNSFSRKIGFFLIW